MHSRINRKIKAIRRAQDACNQNRLCELVLTPKEVEQLLMLLLQSSIDSMNNGNAIVVHFLSEKEQLQSAIIPNVYVQRLNILVDVLSENVGDRQTNLDSDDCYNQLVDFLNQLSDI